MKLASNFLVRAVVIFKRVIFDKIKTKLFNYLFVYYSKWIKILYTKLKKNIISYEIQNYTFEKFQYTILFRYRILLKITFTIIAYIM